MPGNICPSCNKFASLEAQDPEVNHLEIDEDGGVEAGVRVALVSSCCGDEVKEFNFEFDNEAPTDLQEHIAKHRAAGEEFELEIEEDSSEATERSQNKDRNGKPIKLSRYMKTMRGVSVQATVTCSCKKTFAITLDDEVGASEFEELN